uniref:Uncharacterized protein n=1 Tax=Vespula pensylvanica TaxID=30213 RepID=A0A834MZ21_VESPE|nr:hypothetical protein H0235_017777 [Vespula pensylvanica]
MEDCRTLDSDVDIRNNEQEEEESGRGSNGGGDPARWKETFERGSAYFAELRGASGHHHLVGWYENVAEDREASQPHQRTKRIDGWRTVTRCTKVRLAGRKIRIRRIQAVLLRIGEVRRSGRIPIRVRTSHNRERRGARVTANARGIEEEEEEERGSPSNPDTLARVPLVESYYQPTFHFEIQGRKFLGLRCITIESKDRKIGSLDLG